MSWTDYFSTGVKGEFPYKAYTTTNVDPARVDPARYGHHRSYVPRRGLRIWAFEVELGYDLFLLDYKNEILDGI